jgi:hypothetical protein
MKHIFVIAVFGTTLAGCSNVNIAGPSTENVVLAAPVAVESSELRPVARPIEGAEVASPPVVASGALGETVASLGNPSEPGLWLKTPLVKAQTLGRVSYNGKSANVTLIPIEGPATAGSRMSLQAFQTLGAPLTDLVTVSVVI